jgi:hypothetical protein
MPEKGWLLSILEDARKDVNSRPDWEKDRVYGCDSADKLPQKDQTDLSRDSES